MSHGIESYEELEQLVLTFGFLPFFKNTISGFSVEEHTPLELWFPDDEDVDGPWEWKGPVARNGKCVYGKFFRGKAGFVSLDWFPDFANYRRNGYDFDAKYEDGLASRKEKQIYDTILQQGSLLTKELKAICGYKKGGNKGFETVMTRLQMQTYITIADFDYMVDKKGNPYGWGIARYTTPEAQFEAEVITSAYPRLPKKSKERIFVHLKSLLLTDDENQLLKLIG